MDRMLMNYFSGLERFESHKLLQTQGFPICQMNYSSKQKPIVMQNINTKDVIFSCRDIVDYSDVDMVGALDFF